MKGIDIKEERKEGRSEELAGTYMLVRWQMKLADESYSEQDMARWSKEMEAFSKVTPFLRMIMAQCLLNKKEVRGNIKLAKECI